MHEQVARGTLGELAEQAESGAIPARGEVVLVVGWAMEAADAAVSGPAAREDALVAAKAEVERLVAAGTARGEAAKRVAAATGIPRRALYGTVPHDE